jgi:hypothetical protein
MFQHARTHGEDTLEELRTVSVLNPLGGQSFERIEHVQFLGGTETHEHLTEIRGGYALRATELDYGASYVLPVRLTQEAQQSAQFLSADSKKVTRVPHDLINPALIYDMAHDFVL